MSTTISPIGKIENDFKEKFGIPRQSGRAKSVLSRIVFFPEYQLKDAFRGIEQFSHLWIIFDFSLARSKGFSPLVRPPRLGGNEKVGVFASRSPFRPNNLGLSSVKLEKVVFDDNQGVSLIVSGADILDGTPIYDIKPYIPFSDSHPDAKYGYSEENRDHKLNVIFPEELSSLLPKDKLTPIVECLAEDPRPSYHDDGRTYGMAHGDYNITFRVSGKDLTVLNIQKTSK
jgi:tRNA-Thr(GGU) m(6)t(6)A37 methyltransferase TsaA